MSEARGELYHIYCDESRQTADRYMVFGGLITSAENSARFDQALALYRESQNMHAEIKWVKVSDRKLAEYRALVDLFFSFSPVMHFKSIVFDTTRIDYGKYHKGDKELGSYKFFYQFLLHQFGPYARNENRYIVFLDRRVSSYSLGTFYTILNRGLKKRYGLSNDVIAKVEPRDSKDCNGIQITDILMGAIGYQWNGCHTRSDARRAKVLLAEYIAQKAGVVSLAQETPRSNKGFSIWHFRLQQKTP